MSFSKVVRSKQAPEKGSRILRSLPIWITVILLLAALANIIGTGLGGLPGFLIRWLDALSAFAAVFLGIFIEAVPFLLLGTLASGVVEVFIDREELARWIPRSALWGAVAGSLFGLFFPVCECGVVPFTRRLIYKGVPVPVGLATLLAAPVINPIVIASTLAAFGPGLVFWGRLGMTLMIAILTGLVFSLHSEPRSLLRQAVDAPGTVSSERGAETLPPVRLSPVHTPVLLERVRRVMVVALDEFFEMGRFLVLGGLLAALMQTFVPQSTLLSVGQGPVLSVLVMVGLAVLLSVCSTVDAFIALAFTGAFTGGSILAFLVFGPMVDIKSTLMFLRVLKPRAVAYLILLPLMLTLVFTVFLNYFSRGL